MQKRGHQQASKVYLFFDFNQGNVQFLALLIIRSIYVNVQNYFIRSVHAQI